MYVCMNICLHAMHACMCVFAFMYVRMYYVCMHVCMYVQASIFYVYVYVSLCAGMDTYVCLYVGIFVYCQCKYIFHIQKELTEQDLLAILCDKPRCLGTMVVTSLLSDQSDVRSLGDFEVQYMYEPRCVAALER